MKKPKILTGAVTVAFLIVIITSYFIYIREGFDALINTYLHWTLGSVIAAIFVGWIIRKYKNKVVFRFGGRK